MQVVSLFSGIGGFELAADWMGWDNVVSCEINPFGQRVLKHYWPNAYHHSDIKNLTREAIETNSKWDSKLPTIVVGGFPCQGQSLAGKRKGREDDRWLWPEMLRIIHEIQPDYIVGENVGGIVSWDGGLVFEQVQIDLETEGYEVQPIILPACAVNAPHRRDRVWFIAHRVNSNSSDPRIESLQSGENGVHEPEVTSYSPIKGREEWIKSRGRKDSEEIGTGMEFRTERFGSDDSFTHSNLNPEGSSSESGRTETNGGGYNDEQEKRRSQTEQYFGSSELLRDVADSINQGLQRGQLNESSDTERENRGEQPPGSTTKLHQVIDWKQWPTESPVCSLHNGLSAGLSGITVSKHRNESIRAYGNSVVPPLVLQIFKAIQDHENHNHPQRT